MEKMRMETLDLTSQNVEKIGELFPNCITEAVDDNGNPKKSINFELLKQMLSKDIVDGSEVYELTWVGKKASIVEAHKPIRKTLRPCPEESVNWDNTENLYIEGDNLEALKLLQESYLGKVKMIYIDPPYNTGKDFIYKDKYAQSEGEYAEISGTLDDEGNHLFVNKDTYGRFHSFWCTMIYSRLMLARNLLSNDGVIFISIDDHEVENLKKICNEIFGESNFIAQWNWYKSATPPNLSKKIKKNIEYILCYEKRKNNEKYRGIRKESPSSNGLLNQTNKSKILSFPANIVETGLPDGLYKAGTYSARNYNIKLLDDVKVKDGLFVSEFRLQAKFKWTQDNLISEISSGTRIIIRTTSFSPSYEKEEYAPEVPPNLINEKVNVDTTEEAGNMLKSIFDNKEVFKYPKPINLIKYLATFLDTKDSVILDFFSGSASTAHAVMQLNAEDGGNRKFIMVQVDENLDANLSLSESDDTIKNAVKLLDEIGKPHVLSEIGKERIRRAGKKILEEMAETRQGKLESESTSAPHDVPSLDIGFRVFKVDSSNMNDVYYGAGDYSQNMLSEMESNIKPDRTDLDLLFGCLLEWGLPLSMPYTSEKIDGFTVHTYNDGALIACFDENISDTVVKAIAKKQPLRAVFRDSSFASSPAKINVGEIFKMFAPDTRVKVI